MYILITYDVNTTTTKGQKRLREVAKVCQNYGQRVQSSVFECLITPAQMVFLENQLKKIIDPNLDSIRIYHLGKNHKEKIQKYGKEKGFDIEGELFI